MKQLLSICFLSLIVTACDAPQSNASQGKNPDNGAQSGEKIPPESKPNQENSVLSSMANSAAAGAAAGSAGAFTHHMTSRAMNAFSKRRRAKRIKRMRRSARR